MRFRYAAMPAFLMVTAALAQPTLSPGTHVPVAGQEFPVLSVDSFISAGPQGANVMMDYWFMLHPNTGNRTWYYQAASASPAAAQIPTATLLNTDGGSDTLFWRFDANGLYHVGSKTQLEGVVNFTDPLTELKFPCTFGTTWSDNMTASYVVGGFVTVTRIGSITGVGDAYGTLNLPGGASIPDVLRVKVRRQVNDNSAVTNVTRISNIHYFYGQTSAYPMLRLTEDSVQIGTGAWTAVKNAQWQGQSFNVGVEETAADQVEFIAYPNPTDGVLYFARNGAEVAEVMDASGRIVSTHRISADRSSIDTQGMAPGAYMLRLSADGRLVGTERFVVR